MRKLINTAFFYSILAMIFGVFYREYTRIIGFDGITRLSVVHTHLFSLGMIFFLIVTSLNGKFKIIEHKFFRIFYITYNIGLIITAAMLIIRGIFQASEINILKGIDASVSGIAGIGHIFMAIGIVFFFIILKSNIENINS